MGTPTTPEEGASVFWKSPLSGPEAVRRTIPPRSAPNTYLDTTGYVEANLLPDERIVCRAHLSAWSLVQLPSALFLLALVMYWAPYLPGVLVLSALFIAAAKYVTYRVTEIALTDWRLLAKVGWIGRCSQEVRIAKVESIQVEQGIVGRFLDYGTLVVTGTGGRREAFVTIDKPFVLYRAVQGQLASVRGQGDNST